MNAVAREVGIAITTIAEYAPEIELILGAILHHGVTREEVRAAVRDLIVKKNDAEMKTKYPNEEG